MAFSSVSSAVQGTVPELTLEQVGVKSALGAPILQNISFEVAPQSRVGIVGASGSGKTSLLRLLNRLIEPNFGHVAWRGRHLTHYSPSLLRQQIMLVPQEPRLLGMTVEQAIAYPLRLQGLPPDQISQRTQRWESRLMLPEEWRSRQELELSVGQRQWVSILRALVAEPQVLLLDEPTSALDSGRIEQLIHALQQLSCTVLIVSHQLSFLQKLCNQVIWLDQGTLRHNCPAQDLDWELIKTVMAKNNEPEDWTD